MRHVLYHHNNCGIFFYMLAEQSTSVLLSSIYGMLLESLTPVAQHAHSSTHPLLSLYISRLQHRDTYRLQQGSMRSCSLCIILSLSVAVYCMPVSQVTVKDEHFAEVRMFSLPCHACLLSILHLRCVQDVHFKSFVVPQILKIIID